MGITVFWTAFANKELRKIFNFYKKKAGHEVARNLVEAIVKKADMLAFQTKIGQREELLSERSQEFRYLVYKSYKIIYWYNAPKRRIEIADVFDARQYPGKIRRNK